MNIVRSTFFATSLVLAMGPQSAAAALGEAATSVPSDVAVLRGDVSAHREFIVLRMTLPSTTVVDEYISSSGIVFAVNWHGPRSPDLSQLLGAYFSEYQTVAAQPHQRRSHVRIDTGRLIYESAGHMRDYWGTAYAPALMPVGVTEGDLQ